MTLDKITARKIAWELSNGLRPEQHIGHKTKEVLAQELFSLKNRYNPKTMTAFEKTEFEQDLNKTVSGILSLPREQQSILYETVDEMLNP